MARRGGLGKGLESLIGGTTVEVSANLAETTLPLNRIRPNADQPRKRFDEAALAELTESVRQNGVLQPILVRRVDHDYEIVAGERRYQAARAAGLEEIPVVIREISDEEVFRIALIENLQREDLDPIEEAQGFRTLIEREGLTQEEAARLVSKSRPAVANALRLLDLPEEVQDLLVAGTLTPGHGRAILAVPSDEARVRLAQKVAAEGLTVRQVEHLAPLYAQQDGQPPRREATPQAFRRAAKRLRSALATDVRVKRVRNKNRIEIEFADEEELAHIVEILEGQREGTDR